MRRGSTEVTWVDGTLVIAVDQGSPGEIAGQAPRSDVLLVDAQAPPAALERWLSSVRAVALTSGRSPIVSGLLPLLCALEPWRAEDALLALHLPSLDERGAAIADVWSRYWPESYPLGVDSERPGTAFEAGPVEVTTRSLITGELRRSGVQPMGAAGMILRTADLSVALVRGAAPLPSLQRWLSAEPIDLAIVEVGVLPWPRTDRPLRLRLDEAASLASKAGELWLVGDDGKLVSGQPTSRF